MKIIRGITKEDNESLIDIYSDFYNLSKEAATEVIKNVIDRNHSYLKFGDSGQVIAAALITNKRIIDNKKMFIVGNISALITKAGFRSKGHTIDLLETAIKKWESIYDSVTMSIRNWEDLDFLGLIDSTSKEVYTYVKGNYPTPMIAVFDDPNKPDIISEINKNRFWDHNNKNLMFIDSEDRVKNTSLLSDIFKYKYLANPNAYVWYNDKKEIIDFAYADIESLIWLFHTVQPEGNILFSKNIDLSKITCLKKENKQIITVKTTKDSNFKLDIVDYIDYFY